MEYCERNLNQVMNQDKLTESTILLFMYQIALAIQFLQKNGIVHRDCKPG